MMNVFHIQHIVFPLLLTFLQLALSAERWKYVLIMMGHKISYKFALKIQFIGMFFNQVLPSAIGGDAYRIWQIKSKIGSLEDGVNSVLCDRLIALFTLNILILINLLFLDIDIIYIISIYFLIFSSIFFIINNNILKKIINLFFKTKKIFFYLSNILDILSDLFISKRIVFLVFISAVIHVFSATIFYIISNSLNNDISFTNFLIITPFLLILTHLPISIGGWGIREGVMIFCLSRVGVQPESALAISILAGFIQLAAGIFGGIAWMINHDKFDDEKNGF